MNWKCILLVLFPNFCIAQSQFENQFTDLVYSLNGNFSSNSIAAYEINHNPDNEETPSFGSFKFLANDQRPYNKDELLLDSALNNGDRIPLIKIRVGETHESNLFLILENVKVKSLKRIGLWGGNITWNNSRIIISEYKPGSESYKLAYLDVEVVFTKYYFIDEFYSLSSNGSEVSDKKIYYGWDYNTKQEIIEVPTATILNWQLYSIQKPPNQDQQDKP